MHKHTHLSLSSLLKEMVCVRVFVFGSVHGIYSHLLFIHLSLPHTHLLLLYTEWDTYNVRVRACVYKSVCVRACIRVCSCVCVCVFGRTISFVCSPALSPIPLSRVCGVLTDCPGSLLSISLSHTLTHAPHTHTHTRTQTFVQSYVPTLYRISKRSFLWNGFATFFTQQKYLSPSPKRHLFETYEN